jgi:hypothetical protein
MLTGAQLFDSIDPPQMWIVLYPVARMEDNDRKVSIRIKPASGRSVQATAEVSRYAPEDSIMTAFRHLTNRLQLVQETLTSKLLKEELATAVRLYVEPF